MAGEPGGVGLPGALAAVLPPAALLLPVLHPDRDLDWAAYDGALTAGGTLSRLREPAGPRLGPEAIARADMCWCPRWRSTPRAPALGEAVARTTGRWPGYGRTYR